MPKGVDPAFYRELQVWAAAQQTDFSQALERAKAEARTHPLVPFPIGRFINWELAAATTLSQDDLFTVHWINCSVASNLTLPTAVEGGWAFFHNWGAQTITIKNPATTTIGTLATNDGVTIPCLPDATGVAAWPLDITELGNYLNLTSTPA